MSRPRSARLLTSLFILGALLFATLAQATSALANDIQPFRIITGTDFASAGFGGMRGNGQGTIQLSGVSGTVRQAFLYWHGPTNSSDPAANATVSFAGQSVSGANIGFSDDNCWNFSNSQAYRADVTALVSGNGSYALANFRKGTIDINGASLIVFYDDGNAANNRDVVIFDGNDSNINNSFDAPGWNVSLGGIRYASGDANIQLHVSDGQGGGNFEDDTITINGNTLVSRGSIFSGTTVPNGPNTSSTNGGLWDIRSFPITSFLTPGDNTLTLRTGEFEDCLSLVVAAIDLPTGAAPPDFGVPVPSPAPAQERPILAARVTVVQRPVPNHAVTRGQIVSYEIEIVNRGKGAAKDAVLTVPFDPTEVRLLDAAFSRPGAWVSSVGTSSLTIRTNTLNADAVVVATVRFLVLDTVTSGISLAERISYTWGDRVDGGDGISNLTILQTGERNDDRPTYTLAAEPAAGPASAQRLVSGVIFAPEEPVGVWYNTPSGQALPIDTFFAERDGSLLLALDVSDLSAGTYTVVMRGHWSTLTGVATIVVQ